MLNNRRVAILMATYNGEKYLKNQIESILNQSYEKWDLYIRDDGSTDGTVTIISEYMKKYECIHFIEDSFEKHGACLNFYRLLIYAKENLKEFDYFMLSDQDDIWENNKIEQQIKACENADSEYILVYSDLSLMSSDGIVINGKMGDDLNIKLSNACDIFFNQIFVWGNTVCINRALLEIMNIPDNISNYLSHDHYLAFYAAAYGKVVFIDMPLVRYRRHDDNVSDIPKHYNIFSASRRLIKKRKKIIEGHAQNYRNVIYFINNAPYRTEVMDDVLCAFMCGGNTALRVIKKYNVNPGRDYYSAILNKLIIWSCIYKKYLK